MLIYFNFRTCPIQSEQIKSQIGLPEHSISLVDVIMGFFAFKYLTDWKSFVICLYVCVRVHCAMCIDRVRLTKVNKLLDGQRRWIELGIEVQHFVHICSKSARKYPHD